MAGKPLKPIAVATTRRRRTAPRWTPYPTRTQPTRKTTFGTKSAPGKYTEGRLPSASPPRRRKTTTTTATATASASATTTATAAPAVDVPKHGRVTPYQPTVQLSDKYRKLRGKTPRGVSDENYSLAYNRADSKIYTERGGSDESKKARLNGTTRDWAIDDLIARELLAWNYVDNEV